MKVLVVGANSYIGDSFAAYAKGRLQIDVVDSYEKWKTADFGQYHSVLFVAGLAHQGRGQRKANKDMYFTVNRDLAVDVAKRVGESGLSQFIYLSSMAVYGKATGEISGDAIPQPNVNAPYGLSKYQAEIALSKVLSPKQLCIVRPPMVYGLNCPGNFSKLVKLATKTPVFPKISNRRSMIYIDNLCEFLAQAVENNLAGVHLPQNSTHVCTSELVSLISKHQGRKIHMTRLLNLPIRLFASLVPTVGKMFGDLYYTSSQTEEAYNVTGFEESIAKSVALY